MKKIEYIEEDNAQKICSNKKSLTVNECRSKLIVKSC